MNTARLILEGGSDAALAEARENWRGQALRFWRESTLSTDDVSAARQRKHFRLKAFQWLAQTEKLLKTCCAIPSWTHFQILAPGSTDLPKQPAQWPLMTVHLDQGCDGWCGVNFLVFHMRCNVLPFKDLAHRAWNDTHLALEQAKLWPLILAMSSVCSCDHGPWKEHRFYTESVEAAEQYIQVAGEGCPIFEQFYSHIVEEQGLEDDGGQEDSVRTVFSSLPHAFRRKLPKIATSRWFQIFDCLEELDGMWHQRLVVFLYMCITAGWIKTDGWNGWQQMELASKAPDEKQATGQDSEDMRAMRAAAKNTLHFCTTMLLEVDNKIQLRGLCQVVKPVRETFGKMLHDCRSTSSTLEFYINESKGNCLKPLIEIIQGMSTLLFWSKAGLWVGGHLPDGACPDHPHVLGQNELSQKTITFAMLLVGRRLRQCAWHMLGFPGKFPMLLVPDLAQATLDMLKVRWELWEHVMKLKPGAFWGLARKRSYFNMMAVMQA